MKAKILVVAISCFSSISLAADSAVTPIESTNPQSNEARPESEQSWFTRQNEKLKARRKSASEAQQNARYCASPTFARKDGNFVVVNPGHCDKGGFGEHGETQTGVQLSASERKSRL